VSTVHPHPFCRKSLPDGRQATAKDPCLPAGRLSQRERGKY